MLVSDVASVEVERVYFEVETDENKAGMTPLLTRCRIHPPSHPEDTPASPSLLSVSLKRGRSLPAELVSAGVLWKALGR